jgi:hypothetical protein
MTLDDVKNLGPNATLHYDGPGPRGKMQPCTRTVGPRGGVKDSAVVYRVNGNLQTWKREPGRFRLPIVRGLRDYQSIDQTNCMFFHEAKDCPVGIN